MFAKDEGHPSWWWDCKKADLIVKGKVTVDLARYYKIIPPPDRKIGDEFYYVCGSIKIERIVYANSESQHADNYRHYLKSVGKELDILIPASRIGYDHFLGKADELRLDPTNSGAFMPDSSIFTLNVIYIFPIGGLVLESSVPKEREEEASNLILPRPHNLAKADQK
jgi:hypothetical protein